MPLFRHSVLLRGARGAWRGRPALYMTSAGYTAGGGTLVHAMLEGAGLKDQARSQTFGAVPLERLILDKPTALVLGFFERFELAQQGWGPGRHGVMQALVKTRAIDSLPASVLGCPAWFAGDAVQSLGQAARRR